MKKLFPLTILISLLLAGTLFAQATRISLQDGKGYEVGTASNPLYVTGITSGSINWSGVNWEDIGGEPGANGTLVNWVTSMLSGTYGGVNWQDIGGNPADSAALSAYILSLIKGNEGAVNWEDIGGDPANSATLSAYIISLIGGNISGLNWEDIGGNPYDSASLVNWVRTQVTWDNIGGAPADSEALVAYVAALLAGKQDILPTSPSSTDCTYGLNSAGSLGCYPGVAELYDNINWMNAADTTKILHVDLGNLGTGTYRAISAPAYGGNWAVTDGTIPTGNLWISDSSGRAVDGGAIPSTLSGLNWEDIGGNPANSGTLANYVDIRALADINTVIQAGINWNDLKNYPAACSAGQAITQVGDTLTCTAFLSSITSQYITSAMINWIDIQLAGPIKENAINWDDIKLNTAGKNWLDIYQLATGSGTGITHGNDPDLTSIGTISNDDNDNWLRGYDGSNQYIVGAKNKPFTIILNNPNSMGNKGYLNYKNMTGATFTITRLNADGDATSAFKIYRIGTNATGTAPNWADVTAMYDVPMSTLGTIGGINWYTGDITANFNWSTIANNEYFGINWYSGTPGRANITVGGWYNGDVN